MRFSLRSLGGLWLFLVLSSVALGQESPSPEKPPTAPYRYNSLKNATDEKIVEFMGKGRDQFALEFEQTPKDRYPPNFWNLDPRIAALSLLWLNRSADHLASYELTIDKFRKPSPPVVESIALSYHSSLCYHAVSSFFFLRVDPKGSYLAFAQSSSGGVVFYNAVHDQPVFDFRLCEVAYEDAVHIARVIWWLKQVDTRALRSNLSASLISSTGDGSAKLTLKEGNKIILEGEGTLWSDRLRERITREFEEEQWLNFSCYLLGKVLCDRLGEAWTRYEPRELQPTRTRQSSTPQYEKEERDRITQLGLRFLGLFSPDQDQISFPIVAEAASMVGCLAVKEGREPLQKVISQLPKPPPRRSYREVEEDIRKLEPNPPPASTADPLSPPQISSAPEDTKKLKDALMAEQNAILEESDSARPENLYRIANLSLQQIEEAEFPDRLFESAISQSEAAQQALQRLAVVDPVRYIKAVEWWTRNSKLPANRQFFEELNRIAPDRALALALEIPPDQSHPLFVSAFHVFRQAGKAEEEQRRIPALIQMLHTPSSTDWEERRKIIELLVPHQTPFLIPQPYIDEALIKLFAREQADSTVNFALVEASHALARRGRVDLFKQMSELLGRGSDSYVYAGVLAALTRLTQEDPTLAPALATILKPHLSATNQRVPEILWAIWSADLREFEPDFKRLATLTPEEYEDRKANSSGGPVTPVTGRFHLARQILALWQEEDVRTRARLLLALAAENAHYFTFESNPERLHRLKTELLKIDPLLSDAEKSQFREFLVWLDAQKSKGDADPNAPGKPVDLAKELLKL